MKKKRYLWNKKTAKRCLRELERRNKVNCRYNIEINRANEVISNLNKCRDN
ncbi:hypothetical protein [Clostridium senegalense]